MPVGGPEPSALAQYKADEEAKALAETKAFLADGGDADAVDCMGHPLLVRAAQEGHLSVVAFLLAHDANMNATDARGRTPLHAAVEWRRAPVAKFLVDKKQGRS